LGGEDGAVGKGVAAETGFFDAEVSAVGEFAEGGRGTFEFGAELGEPTAFELVEAVEEFALAFV